MSCFEQEIDFSQLLSDEQMLDLDDMGDVDDEQMLDLDDATSQEDPNGPYEQQKDTLYEFLDRSSDQALYKCSECHIDIENGYLCRECNVSTLTLHVCEQ